MKSDEVYLRYVLECIRRIEEDTADGKVVFLSSRRHHDAVLRNLQTMSETMQRLSVPMKTAHPEIEWDRIAAFRNVLVHDYLGIDLELIWATVIVNVPQLKRQVLLILGEA